MVNFPSSLDSLANPTATTTQNETGFTHAAQHANANDILEALETKVGTGASTPTTAGDVLYVTGAGATAYGPKALRPLYDTVLGGATASFDVTSIVQTYRALKIQLIARSDTAAASTVCLMRFNNDTAGNYDYQNFQGNNTTIAGAGSVAQTSLSIGSIPAASVVSGIFGQAGIEIADYTGTTAQKTALVQAGFKFSTGTPAAGDVLAQVLSGFWRSAAAINRITIFPTAGNFIAGSRLTIWGLPQ